MSAVQMALVVGVTCGWLAVYHSIVLLCLLEDMFSLPCGEDCHACTTIIQ
jgi:hypothetical protein